MGDLLRYDNYIIVCLVQSHFHSFRYLHSFTMLWSSSGIVIGALRSILLLTILMLNKQIF